jgi:hypothetical protein
MHLIWNGDSYFVLRIGLKNILRKSQKSIVKCEREFSQTDIGHNRPVNIYNG